MESRLDSTIENDAQRWRTPVPFSGWALDFAIKLDRDRPGLLAASFRFGPQRRQALFLMLALAEILGINEVADHLRTAEGMTGITGTAPTTILGEAVLRLRRPRDLVQAVLAKPIRLLGALARLGEDPIGEPRMLAESLGRVLGDHRRAQRRADIALERNAALLAERDAQIASLAAELAQARSNTGARQETGEERTYRQVGLHPRASEFLITAARRAYRSALHPDRHPLHREKAHQRYLAAETAFDRIAELRR